MAMKWSNNECGILRKNDNFDIKEELLVFGYSCKLFRDDEKALHIDQGKHLIPWMGDETLKIDRYDARGALHELWSLEAPPGGHDWRLELTDAEKRVEGLCDEERYRALYCDEDEEEMYKEEELKRLHAAGAGQSSYGEVGFNYDADTSSKLEEDSPAKAEEDEPFVLTSNLSLPEGVELPETIKLNAIIEKTASFIVSQGMQMEILLKAKQASNALFNFLSVDHPLHAYYRHVLHSIRAGTYFQPAPPTHETFNTDGPKSQPEDYLHPSLGSAPPIQLAPSIPSIPYKPSADCDYTMLITKIKGAELSQESEDDTVVTKLTKDDDAPPGTIPLKLPASEALPKDLTNDIPQAAIQDISKPAVLYSNISEIKLTINDNSKDSLVNNSPARDAAPKTITGLNLMHYYNSDSGSEGESDSNINDAKLLSTLVTPPPEMKLVIDKMASYVTRNGEDFEAIVRAKNDLRFTFLNTQNEFHPYYLNQKVKYIQEANAEKSDKQPPPAVTKQAQKSLEEKLKADDKKSRTITPVSFSIKKSKEPETLLPKPALPYESSEEDESNGKNGQDENTTAPDTQQASSRAAANDAVLMFPASIEQLNTLPTTIYKIGESLSQNKTNDSDTKSTDNQNKSKESITSSSKKEERISSDKRKSDKSRRSKSHRDEYRKDDQSRDRHRRKKTYRSKDRKSPSSVDRSKSVDKPKAKKPSSVSEKLDYEVISVHSDLSGAEADLIDLTEDVSDEKSAKLAKELGGASAGDQQKREQRRRRAAAFLAAMGSGPAPAAIEPVLEKTNTLASVMVKTLLEREEKEERRQRKRERRHKRESAFDADGELDEKSRSSRHLSRARRRKGFTSDRNGEGDRYRYEEHDEKERRRKKSSHTKRKKKQKDSHRNKSRRDDENGDSPRRADQSSDNNGHTPSPLRESKTGEPLATPEDPAVAEQRAIKRKLKELLNGEFDIEPKYSGLESDEESKRSGYDTENSSKPISFKSIKKPRKIKRRKLEDVEEEDDSTNADERAYWDIQRYVESKEYEERLNEGNRSNVSQGKNNKRGSGNVSEERHYSEGELGHSSRSDSEDSETSSTSSSHSRAQS